MQYLRDDAKLMMFVKVPVGWQAVLKALGGNNTCNTTLHIWMAPTTS
jgi:hypothetical protein